MPGVMRSNPISTAVWGVEAIGLAPTQAVRFRTQCAAATGIRQAGRCATTAIALCLSRDPSVEVLKRQLTAWFRWLRGGIPRALHWAWKRIFERVLPDPSSSPVTKPSDRIRP